MEHFRSPEEAENLSWAEIAGLVRIHPDGSWEMTDLAKEWVKEHPHLVQERPQGRAVEASLTPAATTPQA